jgi:hypothetical protein
MKQLIFSILVLTCISAYGQNDLKPTTSFLISGKVKSNVTIGFADLKKLKSLDIGDVAITNHLGEPKSSAKGLKGVLLKDVLGLVEIDSENPKVLSEYYFVCKANDGYTVVYSWNELFNTAVGDTAYIVTEKEGKKLEQMKDAILMISPKDIRTGRRHVKALMTIEVKRA